MAGGVAVAPGPRVETVGVRFTPAGLAPLCAFPQARLADRIVPLDGLRAPGLRTIAAAAAEAPTLGDALDALRRELPRAYASAAPLDARLLIAVARITDSGGTAPLEAIAKTVGASPRWLERHFQAAVGIDPEAAGPPGALPPRRRRPRGRRFGRRGRRGPRPRLLRPGALHRRVPRLRRRCPAPFRPGPAGRADPLLRRSRPDRLIRVGFFQDRQRRLADTSFRDTTLEPQEGRDGETNPGTRGPWSPLRPPCSSWRAARLTPVRRRQSCPAGSRAAGRVEGRRAVHRALDRRRRATMIGTSAHAQGRQAQRLRVRAGGAEGRRGRLHRSARRSGADRIHRHRAVPTTRSCSPIPPTISQARRLPHWPVQHLTAWIDGGADGKGPRLEFAMTRRPASPDAGRPLQRVAVRGRTPGRGSTPRDVPSPPDRWPRPESDLKTFAQSGISPALCARSAPSITRVTVTAGKTTAVSLGQPRQVARAHGQFLRCGDRCHVRNAHGSGAVSSKAVMRAPRPEDREPLVDGLRERGCEQPGPERQNGHQGREWMRGAWRRSRWCRSGPFFTFGLGCPRGNKHAREADGRLPPDEARHRASAPPSHEADASLAENFQHGVEISTGELLTATRGDA